MTDRDLPTTGLSGFVLNKNVRTTLTQEERVKIKLVKGCPVNRRAKTKMTRSAFVRMCLLHQKAANVGGRTVEDLAEHKHIPCLNNGDGFKDNNWYVCVICKIGEKVRDGKTDFKPPENLTFVSGPTPTKEEAPGKKVKKTKKVKKVVRKRKKGMQVRNRKVTDELVREIRSMLAGGASVNRVHFNIKEVISKRAIYLIRSGDSWSHVK